MNKVNFLFNAALTFIHTRKRRPAISQSGSALPFTFYGKVYALKRIPLNVNSALTSFVEVQIRLGKLSN